MSEDRGQIEQGLRRIVAGEVDNPAAREAVVQAGLSADQTRVPLLKEIAQATSTDRNRKVTFDALYSLWQLGESREYFRENARAHQRNKWLAYYSILVLGSDPDDEKTIEVLIEIKAASTDNQIRGAIAEAERVRFLAGEYGQQQTPQQKSSFLLAHFRSYWNPVSLGESEIGTPANPLAIWSQKKLFELSHESPEVVAQAVFEIDLAKDYGSDSFTKSYRAHIAQFLSEAAREMLRNLEEQETK